MFDFLGLKNSITKISSQAAGLRNNIETKKQKRDELTTAPRPRKDIADNLCDMIDKLGDDYPRRLAMSMVHMIHDPMYCCVKNPIDIIGTLGGSSDSTVVPRENFSWFFRVQIKQRVRDAVDVMPWPDDEAGAPWAERKVMIEKLDAEISDLEEKLAELLLEAERAGIRL